MMDAVVNRQLRELNRKRALTPQQARDEDKNARQRMTEKGDLFESLATDQLAAESFLQGFAGNTIAPEARERIEKQLDEARREARRRADAEVSRAVSASCCSGYVPVNNWAACSGTTWAE
jgi:ElaB/YqjD/DUF883 family membrane-anchored ribosome-binding protein